MNSRFDYEIKVEYVHTGVETFFVENKLDAADAVIHVMKMIRAKVRKLSVSRPVEKITVIKVTYKGFTCVS